LQLLRAGCGNDGPRIHASSTPESIIPTIIIRLPRQAREHRERDALPISPYRHRSPR
jgi:hypothetical protein